MNALVLRRFRALFRDDVGVSAIEFAIAAPMVLILVIGTVEMATMMMMDATVQMAAQAAARYGMTNVTPTDGTTRQATAEQIARNVLSGWSQMANTSVTISEVAYSSYSNVGTSSSTSGLGGFGDVVSYNITLKTKGISGLPGLFGVEWLTFQRSYLVQNEK